MEVELAPGIGTRLDAAQSATFGEPEAADVGRLEITVDPADRWAYKTPSLCNVALTARSMHDGSFASLEAAIDCRDAGGPGGSDRSARIRPPGLAASDRRALATFLRALTVGNFDRLSRLARALR